MPFEKSSFQLKVDAAFNACLLNFGELLDMVQTAGALAATDGGQLQSPLIDFVNEKAKQYFDTDMSWLYQRAYWSHSDKTYPETYFHIHANGPWCEIRSRGVNGGKGAVSLHTSQVRDFFRCARTGLVSDYAHWALNPYPVGGHTMLMRMRSIYDDDEDRTWPAPADEEGILFIAPDTHLSDGKLYFGATAQELQQIGALCQLEETVVASLIAAVPSKADRQAATKRAVKIASVAGISFMPVSGYCSFCDADVTPALAEITPGDSITGCPVCGHTWCD